MERHLRCGGNWNWRAAGNSLLGVYAGIEYLRSVTGQKHLVALTSQGFVLPFYVRTTYGLFFRDTTDEARLATRANDAGVTIDVIDTAGTQPYGYFVPLSRLSNKNLAFVAGGQFASLRSATDALQRLDASSRHSYLIGYMPSSPALDGKYRKVDVKVNRQDVTVTYRRGYTARAEPPPLDLRVVDIMTRLREAAASDTHQTDLKVTAEAAVVSANPKDGQVRVTATIDGSRIAFTRNGALREGAIDVLILCGDKNQNVVGKIQHQLSMSLDEQKYQRAITDGMPYSVTIPVTGATTYVKVVVYDYESDRLGTAVVKLR